VRFTIDSNILVYAIDANAPEKHRTAQDILARAPFADAVLTAQALAEFLAVIRRKYPEYLREATAQAGRWAEQFPVLPTDWENVANAARLSAAHDLQLWDCLIWNVAQAAGASIFISEDLQDGLTLEGMTVLDPFPPGNAALLGALLTQSD
jgi:predicted nucleic acid-binding protein